MRNIEDFGGFEKITRTKARRNPREAYNDRLANEQNPTQDWSAWGNKLTGHRPQPLVPQEVLVGDVLFVKDKVWGFENVKSEDHLGVCAYNHLEQDIPFLKGTDARNINPRYRALNLVFKPSEKNGLKKMTAFERKPRLLRFNHIKNYYPERHIGRLDEDDQMAVMDAAVRFWAADEAE